MKWLALCVSICCSAALAQVSSAPSNEDFSSCTWLAGIYHDKGQVTGDVSPLRTSLSRHFAMLFGQNPFPLVRKGIRTIVSTEIRFLALTNYWSSLAFPISRPLNSRAAALVISNASVGLCRQKSFSPVIARARLTSPQNKLSFHETMLVGFEWPMTDMISRGICLFRRPKIPAGPLCSSDMNRPNHSFNSDAPPAALRVRRRAAG